MDAISYFNRAAIVVVEAAHYMHGHANDAVSANAWTFLAHFRWDTAKAVASFRLMESNVLIERLAKGGLVPGTVDVRQGREGFVVLHILQQATPFERQLSTCVYCSPPSCARFT